MLRLMLAMAFCLALLDSASHVVAQPITVAQNPVLAEIFRYDPERAAAAELKLTAIVEKVGHTATKGGTPTRDEARQIAINPAFARAYEHDPEDTLMLLRDTNEFLAKRQRGKS